MKCPNCGTELPENAVFCSECGTKIEKPAASAGGGIALGNKNVVAGDVVGEKEEYKISGNATIVKNEDETKKVLTCGICGKHLANSEGHNCPQCGRFVCAEHFDAKKNFCTSCAKAAAEANLQTYKDELAKVYADGKVELEERKKLEALRKGLEIDENTAKYLESNFNIQFQKASDSLLRIEAINLKKARDLLLYKFDCRAAHELLQPLYQKHGDNEEIISLYLRVLSLLDADAFSRINGVINIDLLEGHLSQIDVFIASECYNEAERVLNRCKDVFKGNALVCAKEVEYLLAAYESTKAQAMLEDAQKCVSALPEGGTDYEKAAVDFAKAIFARAKGDEDAYQALCANYGRESGNVAFFVEKHHKALNEVKCAHCGKWQKPHPEYTELCQACGAEKKRQEEERIAEEKRIEEERLAEERRQEEEKKRKEEERRAEERRLEEERQEAKRRQEEEQREIERQKRREQQAEEERMLAREKKLEIAAIVFKAVAAAVMAVWIFFYFRDGRYEMKRYEWENFHFWHFSWVLGVVCAASTFAINLIYVILRQENKIGKLITLSLCELVVYTLFVLIAIWLLGAFSITMAFVLVGIVVELEFLLDLYTSFNIFDVIHPFGGIVGIFVDNNF